MNLQSDKSKVSVIVPVYNVEKYLEECVESILRQTYDNIEIILVDDGSPDSSGKICDRYAAEYPGRIKVVHKKNGGLSSARNAGLPVATGEYVAFVDSDDTILPEMYTEMVEAMQTSGATVVCSRFLPGGNVAPSKSSIVHEDYTATGIEVLRKCLSWKLDISACTKLYRRDAIGNLRFIEGITNEDFPFNGMLLMQQPIVYVMGKGYYNYRINPTSITKTFNDSFFDIFGNLEMLRKMLPEGDKALADDYERYELQMNIFAGLRIVRARKNRQYKKWLRRHRAHILRNWRRLLSDRGLSMRWRVKAAAAFLHLP